MRMMRSVLLTTLVALLVPVLAQADYCSEICQNERQECMASQCPTMVYCEECEAVYSNCMSSCQNPDPGCIQSGSIDDTLDQTHCCSGQAEPGSTYCINPADFGTTWASCSHICA